MADEQQINTLSASDEDRAIATITIAAHALERCDQDRLPAYLEATTSRSRALYERHGFEELGVIQEGSTPPMWPMLRPPR